MNRRGRRGLSTRLGRLFAAQLTMIGIATVIGVYITQLVVEDLLTRRALSLEAAHFWERHEANPDHPLPDTANMRGYFASGAATPASHAAVPSELRHQPGFRRIEFAGRSRLLHVSERRGNRLYLVFDSAQVSDLAFYFGILPLSIVLLLIYAVLFVAYRWSQAALSPIVRLARQLATVDFERAGGVQLDLGSLRRTADAEVATMIDALDRFTARLDAALERERVFTRDAGHELRTPVAVFKGSLDLLERDAERPPHDRRALARMRRTVADMESLLETLLLLARENAIAPEPSATSVNKVVKDEVESMRDLATERGNRVTLREEAEAVVAAPAEVVRIVAGNLLRNALSYTNDGDVKVTVRASGLSVADTGIGMSGEELAHAFKPFYRVAPGRDQTKGHGLGLSIVQRLARHHGWTVRARSRPRQGTSVDVDFDPADGSGVDQGTGRSAQSFP